MAILLMKMMATYLMKLCLIEYVLDEVNLMYLQRVQKAMKKGFQHVLNLDEKSMSLGIRGFS